MSAQWLLPGLNGEERSRGTLDRPIRGSRKRPDPPRARDGPGLVICPEWSAGTDDQLTNAVACAWFELHPHLRYIKYKVAEPDQV
jgi:hypothetical protein